jgi:hypothetical protein
MPSMVVVVAVAAKAAAMKQRVYITTDTNYLLKGGLSV